MDAIEERQVQEKGEEGALEKNGHWENQGTES